MNSCSFAAPISQQIWEQKYRLRHANGLSDENLADTFWRVARAAASVEAGPIASQEKWAGVFFDAMSSFLFLPGGRILAGAGSDRKVTLFNCFVLGDIGDDLANIFDSLKEAALTMQAGGGIGHDFSTLRPRGSMVGGVGTFAAGPVSFMDLWDRMCGTIRSAGERRGAMMGTLRCDHPDIAEFIAAKSNADRLRNFNLSVLVTDKFLKAVTLGAAWDLQFDGHIYRRVDARTLWQDIITANYTYAEPGVVFIDRVNAENNLGYCEVIHATNPCGEQPLPPYGACLLGSINLAAFITDPFSDKAVLDENRLRDIVAIAVRFLDNIIDVSNFPLPKQLAEAKSKRRLGLGITGLADALILLGARYGSNQARSLAGRWMSIIQEVAYLTSSALAQERGAFPLFNSTAFLAAPHVTGLSEPVRAAIQHHGIRNGCLTSIAPAGTISLLAGNVSSGVEPVFDFRYQRKFLVEGDKVRVEVIEDFAHALYRQMHGGKAPVGEEWVTAAAVPPCDHLAMQAALQPFVDSAISKTINCAVDISRSDFNRIYDDAYEYGLKGCTTFRPNAVTGSILSSIASDLGSQSCLGCA